MKTFKNRKDGFIAIRKQIILRAMLLIVLTAGIIIPVVVSQSAQQGNDAIDPFILIPVLVVFYGVMFRTIISRAMKIQKGKYESYTLTITDNLITREQQSTPTISIYFNEVKEIIKSKNGRFVIHGKEAGDRIIVHEQIDDCEALETELQRIKPIVTKSNVTVSEKRLVLIALAACGLTLGFYFLFDNIFIALVVAAIVIVIAGSFIKIRNDKNMDSHSKSGVLRGMWFVIIIIAISVINASLKKFIPQKPKKTAAQVLYMNGPAALNKH